MLSVPAVIAGVVVTHLGLRATSGTFGSVVAGIALMMAAGAWHTRPQPGTALGLPPAGALLARPDGRELRRWASLDAAAASPDWPDIVTGPRPGQRRSSTAAYCRAGHHLLDSLTGSLPQHLPTADARDTASQPQAPRRCPRAEAAQNEAMPSRPLTRTRPPLATAAANPDLASGRHRTTAAAMPMPPGHAIDGGHDDVP